MWEGFLNEEAILANKNVDISEKEALNKKKRGSKSKINWRLNSWGKNH